MHESIKFFISNITIAILNEKERKTKEKKKNMVRDLELRTAIFVEG